MKLYLVHALVTTDNSAEQVSKWAGSQAEAGKLRKEFQDRGAKRSSITTEEIDVPTKKADLLDFLNTGRY